MAENQYRTSINLHLDKRVNKSRNMTSTKHSYGFRQRAQKKYVTVKS